MKAVRHWEIPVIGLLGLWFAVSPWALGSAENTRMVAVNVVLGLALATAAASMTRTGHASSAAWGGLVLGLVTAVSPWLLGNTENVIAALNAVATGLVAGTLSCMVGFKSVDTENWWDDKVAH